jgi:hypothetical protein
VIWVHGIFNVAKCITYLRSIGVEIDDATAASWGDSEKSHRFLSSMKRTAAEGWDWWCKNHHLNYREWRIGKRRTRRDRSDVCSVCQSPLVVGQVRWRETRDGTFKDYRPEAERWKPRDWQTTEFDSGGPATGGIGA